MDPKISTEDDQRMQRDYAKWYNINTKEASMPQYGIPSRRMLSFLNERPGSTAREISDHLFDDRCVEQLRIRYRNVWLGNQTELRVLWQAKRYVLDHMMNSEYYQDIEILDERVVPLSKICRGKYAYLTSPYCSRTLAADPAGSRTHPAAANKTAQRRWFYRAKVDNGKYRYFLTLKGMSALKEWGLR